MCQSQNFYAGLQVKTFGYNKSITIIPQNFPAVHENACNAYNFPPWTVPHLQYMYTTEVIQRKHTTQINYSYIHSYVVQNSLIE